MRKLLLKSINKTNKHHKDLLQILSISFLFFFSPSFFGVGLGGEDSCLLVMLKFLVHIVAVYKLATMNFSSFTACHSNSLDTPFLLLHLLYHISGKNRPYYELLLLCIQFFCLEWPPTFTWEAHPSTSTCLLFRDILCSTESPVCWIPGVLTS